LTLVKQDLHIHTVFSSYDGAVVPAQTLEMVAFAKHSEIVGISDHFEMFMPQHWEEYKTKVRSFGFKLGTEVNGHDSVEKALKYDFDYYVYHCWGQHSEDYKGFEKLCSLGRPVIIAHPYAIGTDLKKIPEGSLVELNNRYIWQYDWKKYLTPFLTKFRWVFSSDAHQPNWLNHVICRRAGEELGIEETILF
jgi:hypothetical protein